MAHNPYWNAVYASLYIVVVAHIMFYGSQFFIVPNTILIPITTLSLFVLSAAIMGYLFCYQPIIMYLDGKKKEATQFFFKTVLTFALITVVLVVLLAIFSTHSRPVRVIGGEMPLEVK